MTVPRYPGFAEGRLLTGAEAVAMLANRVFRCHVEVMASITDRTYRCRGGTGKINKGASWGAVRRCRSMRRPSIRRECARMVTPEGRVLVFLPQETLANNQKVDIRAHEAAEGRPRRPRCSAESNFGPPRRSSGAGVRCCARRRRSAHCGRHDHVQRPARNRFALLRASHRGSACCQMQKSAARRFHPPLARKGQGGPWPVRGEREQHGSPAVPASFYPCGCSHAGSGGCSWAIFCARGRLADAVGSDQDCGGGVVEEFERHQGFDGGLVAAFWP
jgi:hypothetical protein